MQFSWLDKSALSLCKCPILFSTENALLFWRHTNCSVRHWNNISPTNLAKNETWFHQFPKENLQDVFWNSGISKSSPKNPNVGSIFGSPHPRCTWQMASGLANLIWKKKKRFGPLHLSYPYFSRSIFEDDGIGHPEEVVLKRLSSFSGRAEQIMVPVRKSTKEGLDSVPGREELPVFWQPMWEIMMVKACYSPTAEISHGCYTHQSNIQTEKAVFVDIAPAQIIFFCSIHA